MSGKSLQDILHQQAKENTTAVNTNLLSQLTCAKASVMFQKPKNIILNWLIKNTKKVCSQLERLVW